ncbi:MAG: DegT/DnrJ/EryC1/StrS family aminotransferase [Longimicrobiales bacterium]|nr:DegT/DnrJ/EryC1/StrS family aminotransferase [Longimicrobiales bacterium]
MKTMGYGKRNWFGRHLALLGGTTSYADCVAATASMLQPGSLVEGRFIEEYERAFAERVGVDHAFSFCNGRVGLYGILRSLGVGEGDEVLMQVPTHIVVANAVRYLGATPIYVDCGRVSFNIDLEDAQRRLTPRSKVLLVQHTYGIPVDMDGAHAFADAHDLIVVEDCVHSLGATYKGRPTGSFGRAAFFSTEETKMISTSMGGMATTDDPDLARDLRDFHDQACARPGTWLAAQYLIKLMAYQVLMGPRIHRYARPVYDMLGRFQPLPKPVTEEEYVGGKPEDYLQILTNGQARMGLRQVKRLDDNLEHRRMIADVYAETFPLAEGTVPAGAEPSWCRYPVRVKNRALAEERLKPYAVPGTWFSQVLSNSPESVGYVQGSCPNAEATIGHVINLPTHGRVRPDDARRLAAIVQEACADARSGPTRPVSASQEPALGAKP